MKLSCVISKTYQEQAYEPIRIELGLERDTKDEMKESMLIREYKHLANLLQDAIEEIMLERVKERS